MPMLIAHVVSRNVPVARPELDVLSAARLLLESRCGVLPVVAEDAGGARVVGVLRYRDAFAATYDGDAEHRTGRELDMCVRGIDDAVSLLQDEQARARRAVLDQHLTGRRLELGCVGRNVTQRLVVEPREQRLRSQPLDQHY